MEMDESPAYLRAKAFLATIPKDLAPTPEEWQAIARTYGSHSPYEWRTARGPCPYLCFSDLRGATRDEGPLPTATGRGTAKMPLPRRSAMTPGTPILRRVSRRAAARRRAGASPGWRHSTTTSQGKDAYGHDEL
jgi:hypothetical protein